MSQALRHPAETEHLSRTMVEAAKSAFMQPQPERPQIRCTCGRPIFDGAAIHARVVVVLVGKVAAKCQCKAWVELPLAYVG